MRIIIPILMISFFLNAPILAQDFKYYSNTIYKVIAVSGLNLRAKPDVSSKVIKKIPYGDAVSLIHKDDYGFEALDSVVSDTGQKYYASGFWIKVSDGKNNGYLNTAYLYPVYDTHYINRKIEEKSNIDYFLLTPGSGCRDNIVSNYHDTYWYGLYDRGESKELKSITFQYYRQDGNMSDLGIVVKNDKHLLYIIGSKKALPEGVIESKFTHHHFVNDIAPVDTLERERFENDFLEVKEKGSLREWKSGKETIRKYYWDQSIYAKHNDKIQWISDESYIDWVGDLDQDGIMDYIVTHGEKNAMTILYLSSGRRDEEIVRPVAIYYSGYCC